MSIHGGSFLVLIINLIFYKRGNDWFSGNRVKTKASGKMPEAEEMSPYGDKV